LTLFSLALAKEHPKNWAVILATTSSWKDYRHQSDIHRVYRGLINQGMDPANIITFSWETAAYNEMNPR